MDPLVSDEGFSIWEIHKALKKCGSSYEVLVSKLVELAIALDIPAQVIRTVKRYVNDNIGDSSAYIIHEILVTWRAKVNSRATLSALSKTLEDMDLLHCADALRRNFHLQFRSDENSNPTNCGTGNRVDMRGRIARGTFEARGVTAKRVLIDSIDFADREVNLLTESNDLQNNVGRWLCTEGCERFLYNASVLKRSHATVQDWIEGKYVNESLDPIRLLREATEGLCHLHSLRIVHMDITPASLLLVGGDGCKVRTMISNLGGHDKEIRTGNNNSVSNSRTSTSGWMAPETYIFQKNIVKLSPAVDIFSLGCVYYYVLTLGSHPFGNPVHRQSNILNKEYKLNLEGISWLSLGSSQLVSSMLSRKPWDRPGFQLVLNHPNLWSQEGTLSQRDCLQWKQRGAKMDDNNNVENKKVLARKPARHLYEKDMGRQLRISKRILIPS